MKTADAQSLRTKLKEVIRGFFCARNYQEVETPIAVISPGTEVHLRYFKTDWLDYQHKKHLLFLRSSPELHMKQLLAEGMPRIFQFATCFRNGGERSDWHHPEFTMLEWYEAGISYEDFITQTGELIDYCRRELAPMISRLQLKAGTIPDTFERITVADAFKRFAGIDLIDRDPAIAKKAIAANVISVREDDDFETTFFKVLIEKIEPAIAERSGVVLYDYPASQAALAVIEGSGSSQVARRFEYYCGRVELSNGFKELLDVHENRKRIAEANTLRQQHGYEVPETDEEFLDALAKGIPPCCGNALGFDRLLALICGMESIEAIVPFRRASQWRAENEDSTT